MSKEIWLPVPEHPRYWVSSEGRVRGVRGTILKPGRNPDGHLSVTLYRNGSHRVIGVHRLVALAFIGPPTGPVTRHLNSIPDDNRAENLVWGTHAENGADEVRNGKHYQTRKTTCPKGHPYNWVDKHGHRYCLICITERQKRVRLDARNR